MNINNRYERQTALPEIGSEGQERLARARVLIVGVGGLGCPVALYLAAAGIGTLVLVDDDMVSLTNLQRQVLYTEADQGKPKVLCAAQRLRQLNSQIRIEINPCRLSGRNVAALIEGCDLVLDGTDNFATRYILDNACARMHIPYIYGAVRGLEGQVAVLHAGPAPRTYRDLYPDEEAMCALPPDPHVVGVTPAVVGAVQANEALKILAGYGEPLYGRLWTIDLRTLNTHILSF